MPDCKHEWITTKDANGREYDYCRKCPVVMHEWDWEKQSLMIAFPVETHGLFG